MVRATTTSRMTSEAGDRPFFVSIHSRLRRRRTRISDMVLNLLLNSQCKLQRSASILACYRWRRQSRDGIAERSLLQGKRLLAAPADTNALHDRRESGQSPNAIGERGAIEYGDSFLQSVEVTLARREIE